MIILMKCLNEGKSVHRVLSDFHDEPWVSRVIVIDGGSTDNTIFELKKFQKVEVYIHPWLDWYHDMEIIQSNIALSYVPHGEICFILDFDERMSPELKNLLGDVDREGIEGDLIHVSRRTFEVMRFPGSFFAMLDKDGWPILAQQSGQYPDFQCRIIKRNPSMHWINSPHHQMHGENLQNANVKADIIHIEKDDVRDREWVERKWARAQARRKELGLTCDVFEATPPKDIHQYTKPEAWK